MMRFFSDEDIICEIKAMNKKSINEGLIEGIILTGMTDHVKFII